MAVAHHEAGHALVALRFGRALTGAILRPPDGLSGETQFQPVPAARLNMALKANQNFVEDAVATLMAGSVAESAFWKKVSTLYNPFIDTGRDDAREIKRLVDCQDFNKRDREAYLSHCRAKAEQILQTPAAISALLAIAEVLSEARKIDRKTIDAIAIKYGFLV